MKDLFDDLRAALPQESFKGSKASKWEVLAKAIDYIETLEHLAQDRASIARERDELRRQLEQQQGSGREHERSRHRSDGKASSSSSRHRHSHRPEDETTFAGPMEEGTGGVKKTGPET
ncbi:hypothetical protein HKX48_003627 [Thoreauomyces humboldtii]|nr:hypothetical protein HKX48_003627 [Thoreauomyces humboldtii]